MGAFTLQNVTNITELKEVSFSKEGEYVSCLPITNWKDNTNKNKSYYWMSSATIFQQTSRKEHVEEYVDIYSLNDNSIIQYNGNNAISKKLPLEQQLNHSMEFLQSAICTSPSTNNIFQCYQHFIPNDENNYLLCTIFDSILQKWFGPYFAVTFYDTIGEADIMPAAILCLNNSLFIGWMNFDFDGWGKIYYSLFPDHTQNGTWNPIIDSSIIYDDISRDEMKWGSGIYFTFNQTSQQLLALFLAQIVVAGYNDALYGFKMQYNGYDNITLISSNLTRLYYLYNHDPRSIQYTLQPICYEHVFIIPFQIMGNPAIIQVVSTELDVLLTYEFDLELISSPYPYMIPMQFLSLNMLYNANEIYFTWIQLDNNGSLMHIFSMDDTSYKITQISTEKLTVISSNESSSIIGFCAYVLTDNVNIIIEWVCKNRQETIMLAQLFGFNT